VAIAPLAERPPRDAAPILPAAADPDAPPPGPPPGPPAR
jgi:hypothetical protein